MQWRVLLHPQEDGGGGWRRAHNENKWNARWRSWGVAVVDGAGNGYSRNLNEERKKWMRRRWRGGAWADLVVRRCCMFSYLLFPLCISLGSLSVSSCPFSSLSLSFNQFFYSFFPRLILQHKNSHASWVSKVVLSNYLYHLMPFLKLKVGKHKYEMVLLSVISLCSSHNNTFVRKASLALWLSNTAKLRALLCQHYFTLISFWHPIYLATYTKWEREQPPNREQRETRWVIGISCTFESLLVLLT